MMYSHCVLQISLLVAFRICFMYSSLPMAWETWVQSQVESYQRLKKWYLIPPGLTLSIIRYVSRVKWSNPGKGVVPSPTPWSPTYSSGNGTRTQLQFWRSGKCKGPLHCHYFLILFNPQWQYLFGSYVLVK